MSLVEFDRLLEFDRDREFTGRADGEATSGGAVEEKLKLELILRRLCLVKRRGRSIGREAEVYNERLTPWRESRQIRGGCGWQARQEALSSDPPTSIIIVLQAGVVAFHPSHFSQFDQNTRSIALTDSHTLKEAHLHVHKTHHDRTSDRNARRG